MKRRMLTAILALCMVFAAVNPTDLWQAHAAENADGADEEEQNPLTGVGYTHAPHLSDRTVMHGISVSRWQTNIDWEKLKEEGVEFVFIRCGNTSLSDKFAVQEDVSFKQNIVGAYDAGIKVGVYYSSNAWLPNEVEMEAQETLAILSDYKEMITLPVVYDSEYLSSSGRIANLSKEEMTQNAVKFMETMKSAGYTPMYNGTSSFFDKAYDMQQLKGYECWLSDQTPQTYYTGDYTCWQYASTSDLLGITGNVACIFYYVKTDNAADTGKKAQNITYKASQIQNGKVAFGASFLLNAKSSGKGKLSYKSSNSKILSVASNGKITVKGYGNVVLTVKAAATKGYKAASKKIKLMAVPKQAKILIGEWRSNKAFFEWETDSSVNGYQISFAYNDKFTGGVSKMMGKKTNVQMSTFQTNQKRIYLRVRSYKKVGKKTYYSNWSDSWYLTL